MKMRAVFESLLADLQFALRLARVHRAFTAIAVLTLALGIGANTAVFSLIDAVVLHPLPYPEPDRLYMLWTVEGKSGRGHHSSYPDFEEWRRESRTFERMAAFNGTSFNVTGGAAGPEHVFAIACTPGLLDVLGIKPLAGRWLSPLDGPRSVVITHRLADERFGVEKPAVGRPLRLDARDYTVVGVLPRDFHFQPRLEAEPDAFVPVEPVPYRTSWFLRVVGRLRPGLTAAQAQAEMDAIARRIVEAVPELDRRQGIKVDPMHRYVVQDAGRIAALLAGAVAFLLLIACVNVANLLLARGTGRGRELAIRTALGASRARLVRQLFTEAVLTAALGGLLGLGLAYLSLPLLAGIAPEWTSFFTRVRDNGVSVNLGVLAFTAAVSVLAAILFGSIPALRSTQPASSTLGRNRTSRLSSVLITVEVALSFVLLAGAGLMVNSLYRLLSVNPGFRTEGLLSMNVSLPETVYRGDESQTSYVSGAIEALRGVPGAVTAAAVTDLPLSGGYSSNAFESVDQPGKRGEADFQSVSPGYFQTMGIPIAHGRSLDESDREASTPVCVVNRALVRKYFAGIDPIGQVLTVARISVQHGPDGARLVTVPGRVEIVGVAGDVNQMGLDALPKPEIYLPFAQRPGDSITLVVRAADGVPPSALVAGARTALARVDRDLPLTDVRTMDDWISRGTAPTRFVFVLIGVFALLAVGLAASGIYAVAAHAVSRRSHEIAVRVALGAPRVSVVRLVFAQQAVWLAAGVVAGAAGALAASRLLARYLFNVQPNDAPTYAAAGVVLLLVASLANLVPASRAASVEPAAVLKSE